MQCEACGGKLVKKDKNTYQCANCDSMYYKPGSLVKRLSVELTVSRLVLVLAVILVAVVIVGVIIYQAYTRKLVEKANNFSIVSHEFLEAAYGRDVVDLTEKELAQLQYLRVDYEGGYRFEYGFENPYDFAEGVQDATYDKRSVNIKTTNGKGDYALKDIIYFTGLQKVELLAKPWKDFELARDNVIRSITCRDGGSENKNPKLFKQANPQTLEEVIMYAAPEANLEHLDFLQDITGIKRLWLERAVLTEADVLQEFDKLEEVYLEYPVIAEKDALKVVEGILQCPALRKLTINGKAGWYITDEEWQQLLEKYGDRVVMERL